MYQALPQLRNMVDIPFPAALLTRIERSIEISNTTNKTVTYRCDLPQSNQFFLKGFADSCRDSKPQLSLAPKSSAQLEVGFQSRFAKPVSTLMTLKSNSATLNNASILSFRLLSVAEPSSLTRVYRVEVPLYQSAPQSTVQLTVENPFSEKGEFSIYMVEERLKQAPTTAKVRSRTQLAKATSLTRMSATKLNATTSTNQGPKQTAEILVRAFMTFSLTQSLLECLKTD